MIEKNQAEQQISREQRKGRQPQAQQGSPAEHAAWPQQPAAAPEQVWQHTLTGRAHRGPRVQ